MSALPWPSRPLIIWLPSVLTSSHALAPFSCVLKMPSTFLNSSLCSVYSLCVDCYYHRASMGGPFPPNRFWLKCKLTESLCYTDFQSSALCFSPSTTPLLTLFYYGIIFIRGNCDYQKQSWLPLLFLSMWSVTAGLTAETLWGHPCGTQLWYLQSMNNSCSSESIMKLAFS